VGTSQFRKGRRRFHTTTAIYCLHFPSLFSGKYTYQDSLRNFSSRPTNHIELLTTFNLFILIHVQYLIMCSRFYLKT